MFRILYVSALALMVLSANAQNDFRIKGKITGKPSGKKVMLTYFEEGKMITDSALVKKGSFLFKGQVADVVKATLLLKDIIPDSGPMTIGKMLDQDEQAFFLENKNFRVKGSSIKTARIEGGAAQADYLLLKSQLKPLEDKMAPLSLQMRQYLEAKNEKGKEKLFPQLRAIRIDMNEVEAAFIQQHPDSYVTLDLLEGRGEVIDVETLSPLYNGLSQRIKASAGGKILGDRLRTAMKSDVGKAAINFTQNDSNGNPVSLASFKGKYILLDFWASWCGPCRRENPHIVKVYDNFKDKNFEIIAVSLDEQKDAWLKAIEADGLPWIHVSDLKGWKNEVARLYDVKAVPQSFLIGPDGIILAKNLHAEELQKKLDQLINSK